jgi:hypothetical protein
MNILGIYPSERRYRKPLPMHAFTANNFGDIQRFTQESLVPNVISIDIGGEDMDQVIALLNAHARGVHRDPRVQEAWERYQIMLRLTGDDQ